MKYFLIMLFFLGFFGTVYAVPQLNSGTAFDYSEIVLVGKILSVDILSEPQITKSENYYSEVSGIALYKVEIEEYLKNPSDADTVTVPGLFLRKPHPMAYETYPYEVGQRVLLYLQKNDYGYAGTDLIIRAGDSKVIGDLLCDLGSYFDKGSCVVIDDSVCGTGTKLVDGICLPKAEKIKTVGDDAPFFGIFAYLEDLFSWIFGR